MLENLASLSLDEAMCKVAAVAAVNQQKRAFDMAAIRNSLPDLSGIIDSIKDTAKNVWAQPVARHALIGAGLGAGAGLVRGLTSDNKKRTFGDMLTGGLLGGTLAGAGSLMHRQFLETPREVPTDDNGNPLGRRDRREAATYNRQMGDATSAMRAQRARQEIGILGLNPDKATFLASGLERRLNKAGMSRDGEPLMGSTGGGQSSAYSAPPGSLPQPAHISPELMYRELRDRPAPVDPHSDSAIIRRLASNVPGIGEQVRSLPSAMGAAMTQGRPGQALAQADILGLKNITPWSGYFDPWTAGAAVASNSLARGIPAAMDLLPNSKANLSSMEQWRLRQMFQHSKFDDIVAKSTHQNLLKDIKNKGVPGDYVSTAGIKSISGRAGLAPAAARELLRMQRDVAPNWYQRLLGHADPSAKPGPLGKGVRALGGPVATAATALPLLYREWLGHGYRSGRPAFEELLAAQRGRA